MQLRPYILYNGSCEDALTFYSRCGLGKVGEIMRFAGSPLADSAGPAMADKVLHASFDGLGVAFYASDNGRGAQPSAYSLCISVDDKDSGERVFAALSDGGTATMAFEQQFWGGYLGNLTDRFGIPWLVNFEPAQ